VSNYLHRQLLAASFDDDLVRSRVSDVLDALIEIGDVTPVRLNGRNCLVPSRPQWIRITDGEYAFLGRDDADSPATASANSYVRRVSSAGASATPTDLSDYLGSPGYLRHLARRTGNPVDSVLRELWSTLSDLVMSDGHPIDIGQFRVLVEPPGSHEGWFGRYNQPSVTGRWKAEAPEGIWCAVRPGRTQYEWHPIILGAKQGNNLALDLFDWDEWHWALLARGHAVGVPERSIYSAGVLSFEHPIPTQFRQAMRLIGAPGARPWTWIMSEAAASAFSKWRETMR
jgi:hypothetical protein